jgi:hypothetical protein
MEAVLVIVVLLLVAGAAAAVVRARRTPAGAGRRELPPLRSPEDEQRALHGDVRKLAPGDAVAYEGVDFLVDRTMHFDEGGFTWKEHMLSDAVSGRKLWLSVEDDDGLEVAVWERLPAAEVEPGPASLTHDGVTYEREERGTAGFRVEQTGGAISESGTMEYAEYAAGERLLAFERYGAGSWEVSTGRSISEHALDVYPRG